MKIKHFIRKKFSTVNPYSGVNAIKENLLKNKAIVVEECNEFLGVISTEDIIFNQKTLVIDCLKKTELIDSEESIKQALLKMEATNKDVLPVGENGVFKGLIFKDELYKYISEYNHELENSLKIRTEELEKEIASKDLILSIIAHDLKAPFNAILGFTNLLITKIRSFDLEKSEKLILGMNTQAKNTFNLLEDLLSWARNEMGQIGYNPIICDISTICEDVIAQMKDLFETKKIVIKTFHPANAIIYADKNMVSAILRNLISNAIKFTKIGGNIEVFSVFKNDKLEITVLDDGIGLNKSDKKNLFHINFNKTRLGTENEKGTGFGLIICKKFIDKHGENIWVEDNENKGACFKFTLPIYKENDKNLYFESSSINQ